MWLISPFVWAVRACGSNQVAPCVDPSTRAGGSARSYVTCRGVAWFCGSGRWSRRGGFWLMSGCVCVCVFQLDQLVVDAAKDKRDMEQKHSTIQQKVHAHLLFLLSCYCCIVV